VPGARIRGVCADVPPLPAPDRSISHELDRRRVLRAVASGAVLRSRVCDADRAVTASAEVLGRPAGRDCPICGAPASGGELRLTQWIHGVTMGEKSGTARSLSEIRHILASLSPGDDMTVHVVEVCLHCGWNHLLREDRYENQTEDQLGD
jgi:hypothetical protein